MESPDTGTIRSIVEQYEKFEMGNSIPPVDAFEVSQWTVPKRREMAYLLGETGFHITPWQLTHAQTLEDIVCILEANDRGRGARSERNIKRLTHPFRTLAEVPRLWRLQRSPRKAA